MLGVTPPEQSKRRRLPPDREKEDIGDGIALDALDATLGEHVGGDALRRRDVGFRADRQVVANATCREGGVDRHDLGEEIGVRHDHAALIVGANQRRARFDLLDRTFKIIHNDLVTNFKWIGDQQQDAREKVLKDVLERKADDDAADAQQLDQAADGEGWKGDCCGDQHTHGNRRRVREAPNDDAEIAVRLTTMDGAMHRPSRYASKEKGRDDDEDGGDEPRERCHQSDSHRP